MYQLRQGRYRWEQVIHTVLGLPKHEDLYVEHWMVPEIPKEFTERLADNDGQLADYGFALEDGTGIHVKVYEDYYKIHWDEWDPAVNAIGHLIMDAPHWAVGLAIGIIGIYALFKSR